MIFTPEHYCTAHTISEYSGNDSFSFGEKGSLTIFLLSSGQCTFSSWQGPLVVSAGNFILSTQALVLSMLQKSHLVCATLSGIAAQEVAENLSEVSLVGSQSCPGAPELFYRLQAGDRTLNNAQNSALSYALLCELSQAAPMHKSLPPLISSALAEIHEHYSEVYGIEELARSLSVSKSHLVRTFSTEVGISPGKYLTNVRLDAAKRLLLHRQYNLETIASLCGFAGANYFCHVFKKETGETPAAFRAKTSVQSVPLPEMKEQESYLFL